MEDTEKTALSWYMKNVHRYPKKDFNKITSEIKEYELMRNSFMLGVYWAEHHLTSAIHSDGEGQCSKIDLGRPSLMEYYQYPEGKPRRP